MLTMRSTSDQLEVAAVACRTRSRNLAVVLGMALGGRGARAPIRPVRYAARVFDDRHAPVLASAGELTPYVAELLAEEVLHASHGSRVDLFVHPEAGAALRNFTRRIERMAESRLDIRVHDAPEEAPVC